VPSYRGVQYYRPPSYLRRRPVYRRASSSRGPAVAAAAVAVLALGAGHSTVSHAADAVIYHTHHTHHHHDHRTGHESRAAAEAISFARAQLGKPYEWGGTGPGGFDCSGLVMEAWARAGVIIPRTSGAQWAALPHITASELEPGDLVFFPGSDGSWSSPGHVAMWLGPHTIIQAYATGWNIAITSFDTAGSWEGVRSGDVIGYARP
jgi:cell wall-associated NlpC family hydrolase